MNAEIQGMFQKKTLKNRARLQTSCNYAVMRGMHSPVFHAYICLKETKEMDGQKINISVKFFIKSSNVVYLKIKVVKQNEFRKKNVD